jgi:tryptophan-rich sensory protein
MDSGSGSRVSFRPPSWVFRVVWPILYLLLGYVWMEMAGQPYADLVFGLNAAYLALWLVVYSCYGMKREAFYLIVAILSLSVYATFLAGKHSTWLGLLVLPYMTWLILAAFLSFADL